MRRPFSPRVARPAPASGPGPRAGSRPRQRVVGHGGPVASDGSSSTTKATSAPAAAHSHPEPTASGASPAPEREREPRQITWRTVVLMVVGLLAFIVLTPTLRAYVAQQEELRSLNAEVERVQERTAELEVEYERWQDPAYVQAQARERFHLVLPGETAYRVVDPEFVTGQDIVVDVTGGEEDGSSLVADFAVAADTPWFVTVWHSIHVAGEVGKDEPAE